MKVSTRTEVIGVASGKGGVGKTTVAVNLAIALHQMGRRVMLFDADLGLANSQIALGCSCPFNLSHFMSGQKTLQEIIPDLLIDGRFLSTTLDGEGHENTGRREDQIV